MNAKKRYPVPKAPCPRLRRVGQTRITQILTNFTKHLKRKQKAVKNYKEIFSFVFSLIELCISALKLSRVQDKMFLEKELK